MKIKKNNRARPVASKKKAASLAKNNYRKFYKLNTQFVRFLVIGTVNTFFSYGLYTVLLFFGIEYKLASFLALILGVAFSFKTQGKFVFFNSNNRLFVRFVFCWFLIYLFNIFLIGRFILFGFNAYEAGAVALVPVTLFSYFAQKLIVFRKNKAPINSSTDINQQNLPGLFMNTHLAIVIPCYNEEEVLPETNTRLMKLMKEMRDSGLISSNSSIYYVDDGSRDKTWDLILTFNAENPCIRGIKLSRNRGHQNALLAGIFIADGEAIVSIDADLQDDINIIKEMIHRYTEGNEIIYGVRSSRKTDTFFKRTTAQLYYRVLKLMGVDLIYNHADYRLMSKRVVDALDGYREVNLFLRGIIPQLGFRTATVFYERGERFAGESKYPLRKMLALAADGITSFSVEPLRMITWLGILVSVGSLVMVAWILIGKFVMHSTIPGWASSVLPIYFLGGVQLLCLGIIGEYLGKIYSETKRRPRYIIDKII